MQVSRESSGCLLQAQWKSAEQIQRLRIENRCFRCERQGCYARVCSLLPIEGIAHEKDVARPKQVMLGPNGSPLRAKWKTREQIYQFQMECRCFRCERQGCNTRTCPLLPAINPKFEQYICQPPRSESHLRKEQIVESRKVSLNVRDQIPGERSGSLLKDSLEVAVVGSPESGMNTTPFLVNALVNDATMIQALVDNGCLCSGIIDDALASELKLPRIPITPRPLETVAESNDKEVLVSFITFISLDLDGYVTPKLKLYVIPNSNHQMILGKKWLEDQDAVIHAKEQRLELRKSGGSVYSVQKWRQVLRNVARPRIASVTSMTAMMKTIPVCRASLEDISKALRVKPHLTIEGARNRLPEQVKDFAHLFSDDSGANDLPPLRGKLDHGINLREENGKPMSPPWGALYNMSREELLVLRKTLTEFLKKGWIRPSNSPAASPVLFAKKPNGGLRLCVDYRGLNAITVPDRYPLPLFKETLRQLSKARYYTKLDVKSAFHRIRIREGDEWLTAFRCRLGLFEWLVTPFGLVNAPSSFQRYINEHLREHLDIDATAYVDDILAYTDGTIEEHWKTVRSILEKLEKAGLYLDIDKCEFLCKKVKYLGFIVKAGEGVAVDPEKVKAILEWQAPTTVKGVRSFLGFANFYRCFVDGFSEISAPLIELTKKNSEWRWGNAENEAFERLKTIFSSEPVLAQWDPELDTILEADSSGYAIGGCLSQVDKQGQTRPVAYFSKRLSSAEVNYPIHDKEMHSIVACLQEWKPELTSVAKPFTIVSDHKNLQYFTAKRLLNERQVRYNDILQQFSFILKWRPGSACDRPDALSRRDQDKPRGLEDERSAGRVIQLLSPVSAQVAAIVPEEATSHLDDSACCARLFEDEELQSLWKRGVASDEEWRRARDAVRDGDRGFAPDLAYKLSTNIAECTVAADGVLRGRENRIWVPNYEPLRTAILQKIHDSYLTGHPGRDTMVGMVLRRWFWPKLRESVRQFIRNCDVCGRTSVWREAKAGFLKSLPIPERIGSDLTIDFVTSLPPSEGCTNIMVITDRLSKDIFVFGTNSMTAENCAKVFIDRYYRYFGFPRYLTSDRGSDWLSHFWTTFCKLTRITQSLTTAYHPQSNASERANQEIYKYLRAFTCYAQNDWMDLLPMAQLALNGRPHSAIGGMSPFFLRHGYNLDPLMEPTPPLRGDSRHPGNLSAISYVQRLKDAQDLAQASMASAQQRYEQNANRLRRQPERFKVGDKVWLNLQHVKTPQLSKKLAWQHAKYDVTAVPDALTVELNVPGNVHKRFHVELIKRAGTDPLPSQIRDDAQNPPIIDDLEEPEYEVESIARARTIRRGRGSYRQALVKWSGWKDLTWEPIDYIQDTKALDTFEKTYGSILTNDGPSEIDAGTFVGPVEKHTAEMRRSKRKPKISNKP